MNTREKVLSYCQYCTNRTFDTENGVICSLTDEKPAFEDRCPDFEKDIELVKKRGSRHAHTNSYTTGLWEKFKDLFHPNFKPDELEDVSIRRSKVKFILAFGIVFLAWLFSINMLFQPDEDPTFDVFYTIGTTSVLLAVLLMSEVNKVFSKTPLIHISPAGLKLNGKHYNWDVVVSFIIYEEPSTNQFKTVDSYLEFEFIGHTEETRIMIEKLDISKHDLVNLLANVQIRFMNSDSHNPNSSLDATV